MMRTKKNIIFEFVVLVSIIGCGFVRDSGTAYRYYTLERKEECNKKKSFKNKVKIRVKPTIANPAIDTDKIMFAKDYLERGFYQYSSWVTSPVIQVNEILNNTITCSGLLKEEGREIFLEAKLVDFYHDAASSPGFAYISLSVRLVNPSTNAEISNRLFIVRQPAFSYDADGAVRAFNTGLRKLTDDVVKWIGGTLVK